MISFATIAVENEQKGGTKGETMIEFCMQIAECRSDLSQAGAYLCKRWQKSWIKMD